MKYVLAMELGMRAAARLVAEAATAARGHDVDSAAIQAAKTLALLAAREYRAAVDAQLLLIGDEQDHEIVAQEAQVEQYVATELVAAAKSVHRAVVGEDWWTPVRCPTPDFTWNGKCAYAPVPGILHRCAWCPWGAD